MARMINLLVALAAFAFAGVVNIVMVQAGTYTDTKGAVVLAVAIAAMTAVLHRLDRKTTARD